MHKLQKILISIVLFSFLLCVSPAFAKEIDAVKITSTNAQSDMLSPEINDSLKKNKTEPNLANIPGSLFIVVLLIFATAVIYSKINNIPLKNYLAKKTNNPDDNAKFEIITSINIAPGKSLYLVEIEGKHLVLGATANNISMLCEVDPKTKGLNASKTPTTSNNPPKKEEIFSNGIEVYKDYIS